MKRLFFLSAASLLLVGLLNPATSLGQQPTTQAGHDHDHDHGDHDHGSETLAFCLTDWKTLHFDDANKAQQHLDMVKKLGCEVKQGKHSGHIDVSYRCPNWKSMQVETHKLAEQWLGWLKGSGFDVSHGHVAPGEPRKSQRHSVSQPCLAGCACCGSRCGGQVDGLA